MQRKERKTFTPEIKAKIVKLRKQGVDAASLRERFGCGNDYVQRLMREEVQAKSEGQ